MREPSKTLKKTGLFSGPNGCPGTDPVGLRYPGIRRDGIRGMGWYRRGLNHHVIERDNLDGIDIRRDCTGRDAKRTRCNVLHLAFSSH